MKRRTVKQSGKNKRLKKFMILAVITLALSGLVFSNTINLEVLDASEDQENYIIVDSESELSFESLKSSKSIVFFTSSWCSICSYSTSVLSKEADRFKDIKFYEVNIDLYRDLAERLEVDYINQLVFIEGNSIKVFQDVDASEIPLKTAKFNASGLLTL